MSEGNFHEPVFVTKSFLPPRKEFDTLVDAVWSSGQLTNNGPLVQQFEQKTRGYLGVSGFKFVANGTLALQLSIRALGIESGEIITTPFSYVATTSSILWENCTPVFVDIYPETFCIDSSKIEAAITPHTKAIMPVHVFGNPCEIEVIEEIANRHGLPVIYDAAHGFGVDYKGKSLLNYGDISACSFHATKPFHTIEGGAIVTSRNDLLEKVELQKRFGHNGDEHVMLGINAKANEFQAAMGLCNLNYVDRIIEERKRISNLYDEKIKSKNVQKQYFSKGVKRNYAYYPVVLKDQSSVANVIEKLKRKDIHPRRYFYPSLNTLPYLESKQSCPISEDISKRIMCLPLYGDLDERIVEEISEVINNEG